MRYYKRFVVCVLFMVMIISNCMNGFAQDMEQQSEIGVGKIEGSVQEDIYQVVLPTITNESLNFIIDPQGLINKTDGAAYGGKTFEEESTLFFKRTDGQTKEDYSNKSDMITIKNMSSTAIKVSVNVSISEDSLGGIVITEDRTFTDDTRASLYMALIDGENEIPIGSQGISFDVEIDAAPEGAYEYLYDIDNDKYTFKLRDDISNIEFHEYSFQITGAANGKGDWSQFKESVPEMQVVWKITPVKG